MRRLKRETSQDETARINFVKPNGQATGTVVQIRGSMMASLSQGVTVRVNGDHVPGDSGDDRGAVAAPHPTSSTSFP